MNLIESVCRSHGDHRWHVVRTQPRNEERAESNLTRGGIDAFLPRVRRLRNGRGESQQAPLFPQYLFARFDPQTQLRHVSFARGIQAVVQVGGCLATVDEAFIAALKAQVGADGCVRLTDTLHPGESVMVNAGPFASLSAVVQQHLTARDRVVVLLSNVRPGWRIEIPTDCVARLSHAARGVA